MGLIVGLLIVVASTLGGYAAMGGKLAVLWQPFEVVIIIGAAIGAYVVANTSTVLKATGSAISKTLKGSQYSKDNYIELISLLYQILKVAKTKGNLGLEQHIENPQDSALFAQFPGVMANETAVTFMCDYLRMLTLGSDNPHEMETLMDAEIEVIHHEHLEVAHALRTMADGLPALGIVAAVLGVIKTMGSITEPPEILGKLIGGALVGTFLGVWVSYGCVGPVAAKAQAVYDLEIKYLYCIKAAILAHLHGSPPAVSVEFARKALDSHERPTFYEVEDAVGALPPPA
ncbi:MAG: flagellar motor stator protein MotA [Kiloniellaceae bacterium]